MRRAAVAATLVALVIGISFVAAREPEGGGAVRGAAPAPAAPTVDAARARWEYLRGAPLASPTPMVPPGAEPVIAQRLLEQYRAGGVRRIYRERPTDWRPQAIVLHGTGSGEPGSEFASLDALAQFFARPAASAATHYAVDR